MKIEDRQKLNQILINLKRHPENWKYAQYDNRLRRLLIARFCELMGLVGNRGELK